MCFPLAIPLAVMAAGAGMQYLGDKRAERATMASYNAERARQSRFAEEQAGLFDDSLARAGAMRGEDAQAQAVERRAIPLAAAIAPAGDTDYLPGSSSAATIVRDAATRAGEGQRATASNLAQRIAALQGFGDQLFDTNILNARNAGQIGQVGSFRAGSAAAGEAETRAAQFKGSTLRGLGSLAQAIGGAMLGSGIGAGAGGKVAAGKAATGATSASSRIAELFGFPNVAWGG